MGPDFTFRLVPLVLGVLEARGVPAAARARLLAGLPEGAATAAEITAPVSAVNDFLGQAGEALRVPCIGVVVAQAVPRGAYGWIEFIARLSPSVRAGMEAVGRYYRLLNKGAQISPVDRGAAAGLEISVHGLPQGWGRHLNEYTLALFHRVTRELLPEWAPTRVWFAHAAPDWPAVEALGGFFGMTPAFAQPTTGFEGPRALVDRPLPSGDLALQRLLETQAAQVLKAQTPLAALAARVRDELCRRLGKEDVGVDAVAQALALSPRTLQRRLKEEGLSFQDVLDGARRQFAHAYLGNKALSVGEIAYLLGYSEVRAFDRAFKRWTGTTPIAWRTCAPPSPAPTAPM